MTITRVYKKNSRSRHPNRPVRHFMEFDDRSALEIPMHLYMILKKMLRTKSLSPSLKEGVTRRGEGVETRGTTTLLKPQKPSQIFTKFITKNHAS